MTTEEIKELAKLATEPTGDAFLDDLFSRVSSAVYYRFLYRLVKFMRPKYVVELGVYKGGSVAHIAAASPKCGILAVDPDTQPEAAGIFSRYPNILFMKDVSTSRDILDRIFYPVDICFIDTVHTYEQVMAEYALWAPKMRPGGVMLLDDISENESMVKAWAEIVASNPEREKISLPELHHSGFGAILIP